MHDLEALKSVAGQAGYLDEPADMEPYLREWRGRYRSRSPLVLIPDSTAAVAEIVTVCAREQIAIVPQGGNTGLCGGAVANSGDRPQVLLNLRRLNRIRELSAAGDFMIAEAGCILSDLQLAAAGVDRLFALSLSAEGSCQIGGNLSTNAGGLNVLRYGTARQQVLGLEVVLPDGRVWNGLRTLRKNTAGYDLRDLFIGAEGTLGIITAAALRLHPLPGEHATALVTLDGPAAAVSLLGHLRSSLDQELSAFELISGLALELVLKHIPNVRRPFESANAAYVLVESTSGESGRATDALEAALEGALADGLIGDAVVATSEEQRHELWRLRHNISEAQRLEGASIKHDISLPIQRIPDFIEECGRKLAALVPGVRICLFGHVGDGSLHYNLSQPTEIDESDFRRREHEINAAVFGLVHAYGGSFSAEHGVGLLRRPEFARYVDSVERDLMVRVKSALDPDGLLNPGKIL